MKKNGYFKKILLFLGLVIFGMFVVGYFIFIDIKSKNEQVAVLQGQLSIDGNKQEYLVSTGKIIESLKSDIDNINNSIISKDGDVQFIEDLDSIAKEDGLTIKIDSLSFENDASLTTGGVTNFRIKATALGSWSATYTLLSQLESLSYKIKINRFQLTSSIDDSGSSAKKGGPVSSWQSSFEISVLKYK